MGEPTPSVEVLVSTMNRREPLQLLQPLNLLDPSVRVLIVNQCPDIEPPADVPEGRVRVLSVRERGLSRSRNRALAASAAEVALLADDDVCYRDGFADSVRSAFRAHPRADVITFRALRPGLLLRRSHSGRHGWRSIASVCSVEIALRPARMRGLRFDTRFGLGADYPLGEESVLLADALRRGLELRDCAAVLCELTGHSSGYRPWDADSARTRGAVLRRMYPFAWPAAALHMTLGKRSAYQPTLSPLAAGRLMWRGARTLG